MLNTDTKLGSLSGVIQMLLGAASTRWRISMPRLECVTKCCYVSLLWDGANNICFEKRRSVHCI